MDIFEEARKIIEKQKKDNEAQLILYPNCPHWLKSKTEDTNKLAEFFNQVVEYVGNLEKANYIANTSYTAAKLLYEHSMYISDEEIEEVKDMKIPKEHFEVGTWEEEMKKHDI